MMEELTKRERYFDPADRGPACEHCGMKPATRFTGQWLCGDCPKPKKLGSELETGRPPTARRGVRLENRRVR